MFREGARQGVAGLVGDWLAQCLPWGFAFAEVQVPVVVWHGELDHLVRPAQAHHLFLRGDRDQPCQSAACA